MQGALFFFSSRRRHTRSLRDWSSDVCSSDLKLATVGMAGKVDEINRDAVRIARDVAAEGDALVAGNLSLTWAYDPNDVASADHVRALLDRQLQDQIDSGPPDFWIGETFSYTGEALLFVER